MNLLVSATVRKERLVYNGHGCSITFPASSLIVKVCITPQGSPPDSGRSFPAMIDTGSSLAFILSEEHLEMWSGYTVGDFGLGKNISLTVASGDSFDIPPCTGDVWIESTEKGTAPVLLSTNGFVAFRSRENYQGPACPLLGVKALVDAGLKLEIDYNRHRLKIYTP